jgi:bifunctional non-homologous end joining protein LigD
LGPPLRYSEHIAGNGEEMFAHAAKLDWEGIVSKNPAAPSGPTATRGGSR